MTHRSCTASAPKSERCSTRSSTSAEQCPEPELELEPEQCPEPILEPRLELLGTVSAELDVDLRDFSSARGQIGLDGLSFKLGEEKVEAVGPLDVEFGNGQLQLQPGRLLAASSAISGTAPLDIRGTAHFNPDWRVGSPPGAMLREVAIEVDVNVNALNDDVDVDVASWSTLFNKNTATISNSAHFLFSSFLI